MSRLVNVNEGMFTRLVFFLSLPSSLDPEKEHKNICSQASLKLVWIKTWKECKKEKSKVLFFQTKTLTEIL